MAAFMITVTFLQYRSLNVQKFHCTEVSLYRSFIVQKFHRSVIVQKFHYREVSLYRSFIVITVLLARVCEQ